MPALFGMIEVHGHGYVFSETYEEMKDQIEIHLTSGQFTFRYESEYLGQLAPHIRNMIDTNLDRILTSAEVNQFFAEYRAALDISTQQLPFYINQKPATIQIVDISAPTILTDSLLAPFRINMTLRASGLNLKAGQYELLIDPKLFFLNGNQFIDMAKKRVEFTDAQEAEIGRFLQIKVIASEPIQFISTFPGYIREDEKKIFIHGVFYDKTILRIQNLQYPKLRIRFKIS